MPVFTIPDGDRGRRTREFNPCHEPGGTSKGGQFAARGACGASPGGAVKRGFLASDAEVSKLRRAWTHTDSVHDTDRSGLMAAAGRGVDFSQTPATWYPRAHRLSQDAERDPEVKKVADRIRQDPSTSAEEKAYAGLIARGEIEFEASLKHDSFSQHGGSLGFTADRQAFHAKVLQTAIREQLGENPPRASEAPTALIMGGLSGAGKSTATKDLHLEHAIKADGDEIKAIIKRLDPDLRDAPASVLQRESAYLADQLVNWAFRHKANVLVDGTMKSLGDLSLGVEDGLLGKLQAFKDAGYQTEIRMVDVKIEQSVKRVLHRYLGSVERWASGNHSGDAPRYVPTGFVRRGLSDPKYGTKPRASLMGALDAERAQKRRLIDRFTVYNGWTGAVLAKRK